MKEEPPVAGRGARAAPARSFAKTLTWRTAATADTFLISYLVTGSAALAGSIVSIEVFTKMFLYYAHERAWNVIPWARR